jgi:hypothetical protein
MTNFDELILKFDIILSRHYNISFSFYEINILLEKVSKNQTLQKDCLDFFVKNNILQKNENNYYYLLDKCYSYQPYKNYQILQKIINKDLNNILDLSKIKL